MEPMEGPSPKHLMEKFNRIKNRYSKRDIRMMQILQIRQGRMSEVAPDLFETTGLNQEPIVANMIDVAARDMAEAIAPLPTFSCSSPSMTSERSRENSTLKTKIALGYITNSNLQVQMYNAADWYVTYGFEPYRVEIDYDARMPVIRAMDPVGCYPEMDRFGRVVSFFQRVLVTKDELCAQFPELDAKIKAQNGVYNSNEIEVVFYHDKDWDIAFMVGSQTVVLDKVPNPIGKVMVRVAQRPGATTVPRGQFDDVIFVQLAKARFAMLAMEAAKESVQAPLVVPNDVGPVPVGKGAVIRTNNPAGVGRVPLNIPQGAFAEQQQLEREMQLGARFPEVRTGNSDASIVTGKGVQALMSGYDSAIMGHQAIMARTLTEIVSLCFEVDEKVFAGSEKSLRGSANGTPFEIKYTPEKVIKGDYTVDVTYGLMAGLSPNNWMVFALQARAERMFSRDYMRKNMPVQIDAEDQKREIDIEDMEEALKQSVMGLAQSIPAIAAQGQDPSKSVAILAKVIEDRQKGVPLSESIVEAFAPPEPTPEQKAAMEAQAQQQQVGMGEQAPQNMQLMPGAEQGMAPEQGMPPQGGAPAPQGGTPDLQTLLAGLTGGGKAQLSANIKQQRQV